PERGWRSCARPCLCGFTRCPSGKSDAEATTAPVAVSIQSSRCCRSSGVAAASSLPGCFIESTSIVAYSRKKSTKPRRTTAGNSAKEQANHHQGDHLVRHCSRHE